ncbi:MAG: hypothetical protein F6J93_01175 [Oscillatoria sp. SIO1A7]|nr:hypothetical protein [Oscillatoria sp. SIO1A7]
MWKKSQKSVENFPSLWKTKPTKPDRENSSRNFPYNFPYNLHPTPNTQHPTP